MGSGTWSATAYTTSRAYNASHGIDDFDYSSKISSGVAPAVVSSVLDPSTKAGSASPFAGKVMRECAISDEHPNPTPVVIVLDVTGSNIHAARKVHAKLPQLLGALQRTGGIEDPQIMIAAVGDATCDRVPLQVGQFESDNKIDEMIENLYMEGGGGGQVMESYELAAYFLGYHTHLETVDKQGRKGYVFFIGDEKPYPELRNDFGLGYWGTSHTVESIIGERLDEPLATQKIFEVLQEQYNVYHVFPLEGSYPEGEIRPTWQKLIPAEQSIVLPEADTVCEFIAGLLAMAEAGLDLDEVQDALTDSGFDTEGIAVASAALAKVGAGSGNGGTVATTEGSLGLDSTSGTDRL